METRPAPLRGMSADDGLDEFRVSSSRDVGSVLLNLNGSDGRVFTSAIWTLDTTRGTIGFNADPNDPAMQSVLHSREVTVVGYLESVKVQSAGPGAYVVSVAVEGLELSVKLDRAGARVHSVGV